MSDREISAIHVDGGLYGLKDAVARAQRTTFKIFDADPYKADLSVVKLSAEDYEQLVADGHAVSDVLYVVEGEDEDMYGQRVVNVGWPEELSDAATKLYVDSAVSASAISVDAALSTRGAAAEAKAVGEAFKTGYTEWATSLSGYGVRWNESVGRWEQYNIQTGNSTGAATGDADSTQLEWTSSQSDHPMTATRRLVIPRRTSQLSNDSGFLSAHQSLSDYYEKSETSSAAQLETAFEGKMPLLPVGDPGMPVQAKGDGTIELAIYSMLMARGSSYLSAQSICNLREWAQNAG